MTKASVDAFSTFGSDTAKGGCDVVPAKTALVAIEYQNEFTTEGGKLHGAVKEVMASTGMLAKSAALADAVRGAGGKVFHVPIMFAADASDNPNKGLGILAGCAKDSLFTEKTWNVEFCAEMAPKEGDVVVQGKKGLDAFPNTTLEAQLKAHGIETVVLCGFLTNCCVESTMRTACEKGYNVITVTDCCATTSAAGHEAATTGTFGMFSQPMSADDATKFFPLSAPKVEATPPTAAAVASAFDEKWPAYEAKMRAEGLSDAAIAAFRHNFAVLTSGKDLMIPESSIAPVDTLPDYGTLSAEDPELLKSTVVVKLNGGLGTGMGLEKAKSLLDLKDGMTFLDFIACQVTDMRTTFGVPLAFMLMNSFATSADTLAHLAKYSELRSEGLPLEFQQNKAPKVTEADLTPAAWASKPESEWCPPGHGDLYPAMLGTGSLDKLLEKGFKYMFVSNSDNLGATMDLKLLTWFAQSGKPFAMECAQRTEADKKGGHLAADATTGGLLLRESAQCPDADEKEFQNTAKYKYFNTNNLWVDLSALKKTIDANNGVLPLPVIKNSKTVDPRDKKSTKVLQLETAMGAAIASFEGAGAILIPRTRFAPVKTTNDMLALMSDAYEVTKDYRMVLKAERNGSPPNIKLDGAYKFVDALQELVANGPPSLIECTKLTVEGKIVFGAGVVIKGDVKIVGAADLQTLPAGVYENQTVTL